MSDFAIAPPGDWTPGGRIRLGSQEHLEPAHA
jgi:hypothetical protein